MAPVIAASSGSGFFFIIIIGFLLLWLIVVRPQRRRQSQQQQMLSDLRVGDEVLTAGGIYGTVSRIDDDQVTVEIAPHTEVKVARRAISGISREPEAEAAEQPAESEHEEGDSGEKWRSAFDDEDSGGGASNEETRG